jgi:hypothetical protein
MVLIATPVVPQPLVPEATQPGDERAARRTLRRQIARLERDLGDALATAFPLDAVDVAVPGAAGPRVLSLGDLERVRDAMALRLRDARAVIRARGEQQARARDELQRMLDDPGRHRRVRIKAADVGERGCGVYQVKPRLGIIGMLAGWWHVKLSSGCPLPVAAT